MIKRKAPCPCGSGKKYKRCCLVKARYCYLDESGNTGLNHFDLNQEFFIQGCLISTVDLDIHRKNDINELCGKIGEQELHAANLNPEQWETVSPEIQRIIESDNLEFVYTVFEKSHHLALMIFHLVYDSGLNPAVSTPNQANKLLRMALSLNFTTVVDEADLKDFWDATQQSDLQLFVRVVKRLVVKIEESRLDHRSKELLGDALEFTARKPDEIFASMTFDRNVAPNLAAFSMMINLINIRYTGTRIKVEKFIHDQQDEFGKFLKKSFKIFSQNMLDDSPVAMLTDVSKTDLIIPSELTLSDSSKSAGLQIVDVALWIFKRMVYGKSLPASVSELAKVILDRSSFDSVTLAGHQRFVAEQSEILEAAPISQERLAKGKEWVEKFESNRWKRGVE